MRILQLSPQVPYPLSVGGKVGIFNITKHIALRGHEVTLLAYDVDEPVETAALEDHCELVKVPHSNRNSLLGATLNLLSDTPYNISKYHSAKYHRALRTLLERRKFDIVHVDHLHMAHYGMFCRQHAGLPIVLREHNVESVIMERFAETSAPPLVRKWLALQIPRIRRYEARIASDYDCCCVITPEDERRLKELAPQARTTIIPGGVESSFFSATEPVDAVSHSLCFFGNFDWLPNKDAVNWFLESIFPKIVESVPEAKLFIVGKNVPRTIGHKFGARVIIRGFVDDIQTELRKYSVNIVPLRIGGGIRLKILESFALRVPVVSTTIGCEGIQAVPGIHLMVADDPASFAETTTRLLKDEPLARSLSDAAYRLADGHYRWERIAELFEQTYLGILHARR